MYSVSLRPKYWSSIEFTQRKANHRLVCCQTIDCGCPVCARQSDSHAPAARAPSRILWCPQKSWSSEPELSLISLSPLSTSRHGYPARATSLTIPRAVGSRSPRKGKGPATSAAYSERQQDQDG